MQTAVDIDDLQVEVDLDSIEILPRKKKYTKRRKRGPRNRKDRNALKIDSKYSYINIVSKEEALDLMEDKDLMLDLDDIPLEEYMIISDIKDPRVRRRWYKKKIKDRPKPKESRKETKTPYVKLIIVKKGVEGPLSRRSIIDWATPYNSSKAKQNSYRTKIVKRKCLKSLKSYPSILTQFKSSRRDDRLTDQEASAYFIPRTSQRSSQDIWSSLEGMALQR